MANGQGSAPGSSGNDSRSAGGSSASPASAVPEQKAMMHEHFPPPDRRVGSRRSTIGRENVFSAPPVLPEEQVATRWNQNGVNAPVDELPGRATWRNSNVPAFSNSPRAASPVSTIRSTYGASTYGGPGRSGAMSPVSTLCNEGTIRSASPLRSEITSPVESRNMSPARGVGNIARNGNAFLQQQQAQQAAQQHQAALAALQGHSPQAAQGAEPPLGPAATPAKTPSQKAKQRLSLQTQIPPPPPVPEEDEEEVDVITMSPAAVKTQIMSFRRSRSSLALSSLPGASSSQVNLSGMSLTSDPQRKTMYFGQTIDSNDLVAVGLENAFNRL